MNPRARQITSHPAPLRLALAAALSVAALLGPLALPARAQTALTAAASTGIFADFIRNVGGDRVEVVQLIGDGQDVEDYQPTPQDLIGLNRSQVLFYNGGSLDTWIAQMLRAAPPNLTAIALWSGLPPIMSGPNPNPHFWLNPQYAIVYVERIRDALSAADPAGADTYRANADRYLGELRQLDADLEQQFGTIPPQNRKLVTAHDAFPYLAQRYGFELIGSVLSSEAQEPSPNELISLIRQVQQNGVRAVFVEPQFSPRLMQQVASATGTQVVVTYTDTFPADGSVHGYIDMMRLNARNIVAGLQ